MRFSRLACVRSGLRVSLGLIMLAAGGAKLISTAEFVGAITAYDLIPARIIPVAAISIIGSEFLLGSALVFGYRTRAAALVVSVLTLGFCLVTAASVMRGLSIDCGCFPGMPIDQVLGWGVVVRNGLLVLWALAVVFLYRFNPEAAGKPFVDHAE